MDENQKIYESFSTQKRLYVQAWKAVFNGLQNLTKEIKELKEENECLSLKAAQHFLTIIKTFDLRKVS